MNDPISLPGFTTTLLELVSFILAFITITLNIRQTHWAWLFSIVSSILYGWVFLEARLYGDMGLQVMFVAVSCWGWYQWLAGGQATAQPGLSVSRVGAIGWWSAGLGWLFGFLVLALFLRAWTDTDVPYADGFLTAGSVVGQLLLSRKKLENWLIWMGVDALYVGLYLYKGLVLTALLYGIFVIMAWIGWRAWQQDWQRHRKQAS